VAHEDRAPTARRVTTAPRVSPIRLGLAVATLTAALWQIGVLAPLHPRRTTSLDLTWYFYATYDAFFGALRAGAPLLWNPYQLCGLPWLGTLQAAFFYPPHLLYVLLPTPWALALATVLHLALAAGGTATFARRAGVSPAGATLAGAVFGFAGLLRNLQLWPYLLEASAWIPIGALAVLDVTGERVRRGALLLAFASGMSWLAGSPQATVFACYAWGALFVARMVVMRPAPAAIGRACGGFAAGLLAGALLGAVALLPAAELADEGMRRTSTLDVELMYPFGVYPPRALWSHWMATGSPALLIGALALAPFAVASRSPALVLWGLVVAAAAAVFALGPSTPLFSLYLSLPLVGWFRVPERVQIIGQFALAVLAGLGLDAIAARLRLSRAAPLVVLALLAAVVVDGLRRAPIEPPLPYREHHAPYSPAQRDAYARVAATLGDARAWPFSPGLLRFAHAPKLPTVARLRSIDDYEPLALRRQRDYFVFFTENALPVPRPRSDLRISLNAPPEEPPPAARRRLLDLAAVRLVMVLPPTLRQPDFQAFVRDAGLQRRASPGAELELFENPHVLPRAFVTYRAASAPPTAELLPLLARESFDPLAESFVEGAGLPAADGAPARGTAATIVRDDAQVVEIDATLAAPGLVVLADTYYPGWTATVDGAPAPILPTNHLFRGVPAPAGTHRIRFAYRPRSLVLGGALSLLGAIALAVAASRTTRRR
jgi:hypothetical protein